MNKSARRRVARVLSGLTLAGSLVLAVGWSPAAGGIVGAAPLGSAFAQVTPSPTPNPCPEPTPTPAVQPSPTPTPRPGETPRPTPPHNLCPAPAPGSPGFDPITGLLAWLFTPVFQAIFLGLAALYAAIGDIGIAIIILTIVMRVLLVPLYRSQIVSTRRMQMLQPELRAIQQRYKGDRARVSQEQMRLYKERGINPAAGCLPALLQLVLLIPMYQVISQGLQAPNIDAYLHVLGVQLFSITCHAPGDAFAACINPTVHWLGNLDAAHPEVIFNPLTPANPRSFGGISILAIVSALLQLVQTRMVTPQTSDPQQQAQQRTILFLPLISLVYGGILPAGLFLYWITTTVFSIAQQYLIVGWGSLFPLFGWTPSFAVDHTPRFPVTLPAAAAATAPAGAAAGRSALDRAAGTVRPSKQRGRTSRRGRRR